VRIIPPQDPAEREAFEEFLREFGTREWIARLRQLVNEAKQAPVEPGREEFRAWELAGLEAFVRYVEERLREESKARRGRRRRHTTPSPFRVDGIAPAASSPVVLGAARGFLQPWAWKRDYYGRLCFTYTVGTSHKAKIRGKIALFIDPKSIAPQAKLEVQRQLVADVQESLGPRHAWTHLLFCAYAMRVKRGEPFIIPRERLLDWMQLSKRRRGDLRDEERDQLARKIIEQLGYVTVSIVEFQPQVDGIDYNALSGRLWDLGDAIRGQLAFPYAHSRDWYVVGRPGPWGDLFLWNEHWPRQFAALPEALLELDLERSSLVAPLALHLFTHSRISGGPEELRVTVEQLLSFHKRWGAELDHRDRYELRQQVLHAIREQERWGWRADFSEWPRHLQPDSPRAPAGYWDEFLKCRVIFRPVPESAAARMVAANQRPKRGFLDPPQALPEPEPTKSIEGGRDLRAARQELGLTQAQMAARLGIDRSLLSHIENGRRPLTNTVKAALEALLKAREEGEQ
jgi:DNA-binding XRE family transcriptional regulator